MPNIKKWTDDKLAVLEAHRGSTARAIYELGLSELSGFTMAAIQTMMSRMGHTDPIRSARRKRARRISRETEKKLVAHLKAADEHESSRSVANHFGVPAPVVWRLRREIGKNVEDKTAIFRSNEFRETASRRARGFAREMREASFKRMLIRCKIWAREGRSVPRRKCHICKVLLYEHSEFFYVKTYKNSRGERKEYFMRKCKVCTGAQIARARQKRTRRKAKDPAG